MKLTLEARKAMFARYRTGESPTKLATEYGITTGRFHQLRVNAGIPSRRNPGGAHKIRRRTELERLCDGALLPVYPVRLVSRPGGGS